MSEPIVIAALSGRALAESARRGCMQATVLDGFADSDTRANAHHVCLVRQENYGLCSYSLQQQLQSLPGSVARGGLVFGGGLERAVDVLEAWGHFYPVYGNSAEVLRCVNHARQFFSLLDTLRIPYPETRFTPPDKEPSAWLVKQQRATGGLHIRHFYPGMDDDNPDHYFQRFVMGTPISLLFLANGEDIYVIGFNTQWITAQDDRPFVYRGAINRTTLSVDQENEIKGYAKQLTRALSLRGLNTLDCMLTMNGLQVLELNPRPGATLSLYDADIKQGLIRKHIEACHGKLPMKSMHLPGRVRAHEIVYALHPVEIMDDFQWPECSADRPMPGTCIETGRPVCSVQAEANDVSTIRKKLDGYREWILDQLKQSQVAA